MASSSSTKDYKPNKSKNNDWAEMVENFEETNSKSNDSVEIVENSKEAKFKNNDWAEMVENFEEAKSKINDTVENLKEAKSKSNDTVENLKEAKSKSNNSVKMVENNNDNISTENLSYAKVTQMGVKSIESKIIFCQPQQTSPVGINVLTRKFNVAVIMASLWEFYKPKQIVIISMNKFVTVNCSDNWNINVITLLKKMNITDLVIVGLNTVDLLMYDRDFKQFLISSIPRIVKDGVDSLKYPCKNCQSKYCITVLARESLRRFLRKIDIPIPVPHAS